MVEAVVAGNTGSDILRPSFPGLIAPLRIRALLASHDQEIIDSLFQYLLSLFRSFYFIRPVHRHMQFLFKPFVKFVSPSGLHLRRACPIYCPKCKMNCVHSIVFQIFSNLNRVFQCIFPFQVLPIKGIETNSYRVSRRYFFPDCLYNLYNNAAPVFHRAAVLIHTRIFGRTHKLTQQIGVGTMNLNAVNSGQKCMFCSYGIVVHQLVDFISRQFPCRRKSALHLRRHCATGHWFISIIIFCRRLASRMIQLDKDLSTIFMYPLCQIAHGMAIRQRT